MDKLIKAAELFKVNVTALLDDYNLFLYNGQGKQIKRLRKSLKLTQSDFAKYVGVSLTTIKKWESNSVRMNIRSYERLIKFIKFKFKN